MTPGPRMRRKRNGGLECPGGPRGRASVFGLRVCGGHWSENPWIPAFAGMTVRRDNRIGVDGIIPAFAGMTVKMQLMSFPRRRESIRPIRTQKRGRGLLDDGRGT